VFVSIHCNSSRRRGKGSGTEVYFLSLKGAIDQADADLADLENAADLVGGVPPQAEDDVVSVLYDVKRNVALERSQLLAETLDPSPPTAAWNLAASSRPGSWCSSRSSSRACWSRPRSSTTTAR
jgi:N-acetylmuramoyl-L-alanine amidase